ncbi:MAG: flavodoxin-dependent (E)-4-hydroxy-3-methylbut-2-enyl-diphosphate synthase [bacterium]|nr:flavodoxin-dependent (E)-4-hydroxy-3-methylbut-2-enyl-diphosphate synthase [bacterium]
MKNQAYKVLINRRITKEVKIGNNLIGGKNPILIQSMTKSSSISAIIKEINVLESMKCEIIRIAVPDFKTARAIKKIKKETSIPIVADIHFNYRLAIESIENGADKIRINPGNIGGKEKVKTVINCAKEHNIPIRVGINSGSLEKQLLTKYGSPVAEALVESAEIWVKTIEDMGFDKMVLSIKSSDTLETIIAYRKISSKLNYPLHLGITAASGGNIGIVRSSVGIGTLLAEGIGDTIRVSLTGTSVEEVKIGYEILKTLNIRENNIQIVACPTCGRCQINVLKLVNKIEKELNKISYKPKSAIKIAVMGCVVNGPGEAKDADFGITGGKEEGIIFKKGKIIKKVLEKNIVSVLMEEICKE